MTELALRPHMDLVYVVGAPRSGSTMLGSLLATEAGFLTVGESFFFADRCVIEDRECTCGKTCRNCTFWSSIVREVGLDESDAARLVRIRRSIGKSRYFAWYMHRRGRSASDRAALQDSTSRLVLSMVRAAGPDTVVVDTSKYPLYGLLVGRVAGVRVGYIHLTRDPRAVIYSWSRPKPDASRNTVMSTQRAGSAALRWLAYNLLAELLRVTSGARSPFVRLRYEDLVAAPSEELARVSMVLGLAIETEQQDSGEPPSETLHVFSGNPSRFERPSSANLVEDVRWRNDRWVARLLTGIITWPLGIPYGYGSIGRRARQSNQK